MSDDIVYQKVGEIQQLHPEWDPNDIFAALLTCNCNNAQAILKLMIQEKARKEAMEPAPRKISGESPFAAAAAMQQESLKEQREKRMQSGMNISDYFDRSNRNEDDYGFPINTDDEDFYYDHDFQARQNNDHNTSSINSPKKKSNSAPKMSRGLGTNHVIQPQYAYTAKEPSVQKNSSTRQTSINSYVQNNSDDDTPNKNNKNQSYKSQYNYFGNGFTLRNKSKVHAKVEISSKKRKRSKFMDEFWNSDEEELDEKSSNTNNYNSDSDNNNKGRNRASEKIQKFKSKYFDQNTSVENTTNNDQNETSSKYRNGEEIAVQIEQQFNDDENYQNEDEVHYNKDTYVNNNNEEHYCEEENQSANVNNQNYDENQYEYQDEFHEQRDYESNNNIEHENIQNDIIGEEGPSLYIPELNSEPDAGPDAILISDSDSSQIASSKSTSYNSNNNTIVIDSSPIRNESRDEERKNNFNKSGTTVPKIEFQLSEEAEEELEYLKKISNATSNKRRKVILD